MELPVKYLKNTATLIYRSELCTGCGICTEVCPHGVFRMKDKKAVIFDIDMCMECGACAMNCDFKAIEVSSGVGCAAALLMGIVTGKEPGCGCGSNDSECC